MKINKIHKILTLIYFKSAAANKKDLVAKDYTSKALVMFGKYSFATSFTILRNENVFKDTNILVKWFRIFF